ncbi:MAG: serine/threonine-protein kinase [Acidobacteriia bacterium]|nr:serine/threonine-protein kinase [Terriglobia bacterium]
MTLAPGNRLGPYEILAPLGAGGMGEVYKARDTRLDRAVAIKVLASHQSSSPETHQRFEREARAISQLSHPHICALYDIGEQDGADFLVMELLEGETVAERLKRGALPIEQTVRYGAQIAAALDCAHRQGIAHRDLKPANVMLTKAGVKLLDFGLAKAFTPLFPESPVTGEATAAAPLTGEGVIAGTIQYMSPEHLEGKAADARSDIFALGAVLYEMATGRRAFTANSTVGVASAILHAEPPPISSAQPLSPSSLDRLTGRCLAKDPDQRWQSAHDVRLQLETIAEGQDAGAGTAAPVTTDRRRAWARWVPWSVAAAAALVAVAAFLTPSPNAAIGSAVRFPLAPPPGGAFYVDYENTGLSVSPDGARVAFTAREASGPNRVWIRPSAALEATAVAGTDGATSLFWSPDGRSLAFFTGTKLRRMDVPGGSPVSICDVRQGIGFAGTWGADGQILFSSIEGEAIYTVAASGGVPAAIMKRDAGRDEARLNWPSFLPDGRRFLYLQRRRDGSGHLMLSEPGKASREVMPLQSSAQYVDPGYLVFAREGTLVGQRFDLARGALVGAPFSIADPVGYFLTTTVARFATSLSGTLVYQSHDNEQRLVWFDRSGRDEGAISGLGQYKGPRISPDDRRVAFDRLLGGAFDVWETDLERRVETRLTLGASSESAGPWMPDGRSLFFNADRGAPPEIFLKDLTTGKDVAVLPANNTFQAPLDVSPDGNTLLYAQRDAHGDHIWSFARDGSRPPAAAVGSQFEEEEARFSRDGRFFSFSSNASGRWELYVSPFPPTGEHTRISTTGAYAARWSRDGKELFYLSADGHLMAVPIQTSPVLHVGTAVSLFEVNPSRTWSQFDVSSTGRFLAVVSETRASQQPLTVVLNWTAGIGRRP